jgi:hypothetical protein
MSLLCGGFGVNLTSVEYGLCHNTISLLAASFRTGKKEKVREVLLVQVAADELFSMMANRSKKNL